MISDQGQRLSTNHPSPQISWAPPRAPLPPHRLAKLANALGVATPSPATGFLTPGPSNSGQSPSTSSADVPWRSVTPSTASAHNVASSFSKHLLHVIPPLHLPHDSDTSDSEFVLPPPTASGYHTQFRRGTLVALQSTLQAQLVVIAKEYALPSTTGMVLYLVTTPPQSRQNSPMPFAPASLGEMDGGQPGPRLSEDIWKLIWNRVLRSEREEAIARSQSPIPHSFGLSGNAGSTFQSQSLRPLATPMRAETPQPQPSTYPITPSTSTTSSVSDLRSKSAPPFSSPSDSDTPDTSRSSSHEIPGIELPGLNSQSIIPILAKVEFDIDRRKATWYEPWLRSRRITHANRAESRSSHHRTGSQFGTGDGGGSPDDKRPPLDLKLVERMQKPAFLRSNDESGEEQPAIGEYVPLSESSDEIDGEEFVGGPGIRNTFAVERDPLTDVFGTDANTWADIHAENEGERRNVGVDVVEMALDASSLSAVPEQARDDELDEAEEVRDIMQRMSKPPLNVSIPLVSKAKRRSSPMTAGGSKKPIPPPLLLTPKSPNNDLVMHSPMPSSGGESTNLPYMNGGCATPSSVDHSDDGDRDALSLEMEREYLRSRSPAEEKRVGALFEDLDLGLDLGEDDEEYDENDPNDRRRSQYLMRAQLDEIERTLAQFSPQQLKTAVLDDDLTITHRRTLTSTSQSSAPFTQSNTVADHGNTVRSAEALNEAWPSVPYSSVSQRISVSPSPPRSASHLPSLPRLALNGVTSGAPKAFMATPLVGPSNTVATETETRRRELERLVYPTTVPPSFTRQGNVTSDSPIPLSPDPFGRYPSVYEAEPAQAPTYWDPVTRKFSHEPSEPRPSISSADEGSLASTTPSSRFSADSASLAMDHNDKTGRTSVPLVSVKSFKKLWRRSKSTSASQQPPTPSAGRSSFQLSGPPTVRNSHDQPAAPPMPATLPVKNGKSKAPVTLQFDQQSPYPIHPGRPSLSDSRPTSPSILGSALPPAEKTSVRKSILKSWKSVSGTGSHSTTTSTQPRKSTERPVSNETIKPRRPSVLDNSIPPSPKLPDQYLPSNHARTASGILEHRKSAGRSKIGSASHHSASSQDMLTSIAQQRSSVVMQSLGSTSPSRSLLSGSSHDSPTESRGSFETSQFELISPPKVHPNLSYPYQTLDHE